MKSPITLNEMERRMEPGVKITYRKEEYTIIHHYWLCTDSGERFTDGAMDDLDLGQVHNQYRERYGIPFPEEIKSIRDKYGVSASKMSEILGLGANSWRNYEAGEVPSVANGRLILAVKDPLEFIRQVEASSPVLTEKERENLLKHARKVAQNEEVEREAEREKITVFRKNRPGQFTGYRVPDLNRAANMILFFAHQMPDLVKTKLNKLLYYADFLYFSRYGQSISGMEYRAIQHGPVPADYDKLLLRLSEDGQIELEQTEFQGGFYGEVIQPKQEVDFSHFGPEEQAILQDVTKRFSTIKTKDLVDLSHQEAGWKANVEGKGLVSYREFGFAVSPESGIFET